VVLSDHGEDSGHNGVLSRARIAESHVSKCINGATVLLPSLKPMGQVR
jgi:hypothetical protein